MIYYKNWNSIDIRKKEGSGPNRKAGWQVFSFGGKKCSFSEQVLRNFGLDALKKLDAGMTEKDVHAWALAAIK